ncbi:MAG: laccase domain-containing protein, partial [Terracidiphilus sp.]
MTRPTVSRDRQLQAHLDAIDALFTTAGLVRHRRGSPAGITRALRLQRAMPRATPEDLTVKSAEPATAPNGVRWLPVPAWQKLDWLWHGFSTRQGGVSTVYCPEDSVRELNLGFTAHDDREAVLRNRQLLVEAVTGNAVAPLVTVRQFHSNLAAAVGSADLRRESPCRGDGLMTDEPGRLLA